MPRKRDTEFEKARKAEIEARLQKQAERLLLHPDPPPDPFRRARKRTLHWMYKHSVSRLLAAEEDERGRIAYVASLSDQRFRKWDRLMRSTPKGQVLAEVPLDK